MATDNCTTHIFQMTMAMIKMMMVMSKGIVAQLEEGSLVVQLAARCYSWGLIMLRIKMIVIITMFLIKIIMMLLIKMSMVLIMLLIKMILITMMFAIKMTNIVSDRHDHDTDNVLIKMTMMLIMLLINMIVIPMLLIKMIKTQKGSELQCTQITEVFNGMC